MRGAAGRLARLLALVPYLVAHPGIPVEEAAAVFGVTEKQLRADLDLLFVCGLPGYSPGDLIDVSLDGDRITVTNAETIARPLRLTPQEALSLVVAARTLAAVPGLAERGALDRALAKLEDVVGPVTDQVTVQLDAEGETLTAVQAALREGRLLHLRYHSGGRDEVTERDVDPMRVLSVGGRWYLEGWCRLVGDVRMFRVDRILAVDVLEEASAPPPEAVTRDIDEGVYLPRPEQTLVVLDVSPSARWVADYYPCESVEPLPDGGLRLKLRAADTRWVARLALRLGANARVLEPPELRAAVATAATDALAAYA